MSKDLSVCLINSCLPITQCFDRYFFLEICLSDGVTYSHNKYDEKNINATEELVIFLRNQTHKSENISHCNFKTTRNV